MAPVSDVHLPDLHLPTVRSMEVDLAAAVNPLAIYSQVLQDALANIQTLGENFKPGQVLQAILANQLSGVNGVGTALGQTGSDLGAVVAQLPATVQTVVSQLAAGNISGATNTLLTVPVEAVLPLQNLLPALTNLVTQPMQNLVNVVHAFTNDTLGTQLILAGLIAPLISTPAAAATAVQNVIGAVASGNPAAAVSALIAAPATIADGFLNGGFGPDLGPLVNSPFPVIAGGLLSSSTLNINPDGTIDVGTGGPLAAIETALAKIVMALKPTTTATTAAVKTAAVKTAEVATVPAATAPTVTLSTGSTAALPAKEATPADSATEAPAQKPASTDTKSTATESTDTTKDSTDSTTKPESTKSTDASTDATTGNKVDPKPTSGSESSKSGSSTDSGTTHDATSSATTHDATSSATGTSASSSTATSGGAQKSATGPKHAKTGPKHAKAGK
ncbi:hypothetical protein A5724_05580 [Mycobacterium sp. ACS1612]|nr:hypothetical protein A5724_05580 [Mycobacterium sp. ACS1612]